MTTLIVIRHGESEGNLGKFFTGSVDVSLTYLGKKQAQLVCEYLKSYEIDKVYSSDLSRAYETALPLAESRGLTVEKTAGIREIYGGEWEGTVYADIKKTHPEEYEVWLTDIGNAVCAGGETVAQLAERVDREIKRIVSENQGKTVAVVCHGTPIRALSCIWRGVDICNMQEIPWSGNASVSIAKYETPDSKPEIVLYDYTDHLKDCVTFLPETV